MVQVRQKAIYEQFDKHWLVPLSQAVKELQVTQEELSRHSMQCWRQGEQEEGAPEQKNPASI